ncbi:MAG: choice-of-anchor D domain-containing protein, partial [Candidatus Bipolaricaulia bacterium]
MATRGGRSSDGFRDSQGGCGRPKRVRTRAIVGALVIGLVVGFLAPGAVATSYTDEFETNPLSAEVVTSFSTGTAATGLSYTCSSTGDGCDFTWGAGSGDGGSLCIDVLSGAETAATEKFTIVSRDGKAFVFNSVWMDVLLGDGVWIVGKGPEPFDIVVGTGSVGTYSPPGGSKLVTEVEFSSTHFAWDYIDTVSVELDVPGAGLEGNGTLIENGDTSASLSDDTDMGETPVGTPITKTFTIQSIGDLPLDLDGSPLVDISGDPDFTILSQPTLDPVPSGNSTTFTVQFNPSSSGENKTATVSIDNNSEAHPYTFAVEGTGTGAPEIDVEGNGTSIPDGDVTSELADHTNFGQVSIGSSFDRTFTIQNEGNATLTLTDHPSAVSLSGSSDFSVFTQPGIGSVAPSGSTTFVIRCAPTATGNQVAYVSIANSDADEDPYNFEISGTGLDTTKPEVTIKQAGGQADPTNGSPINFDVVFTEPVTGFATGDVTLSGAAGATTGTVTEVAPNDGTTYNVAVSGMTGDGTVTATIPAGVAQDAASNTNNASTTTDDTVTYDTTGPTVTIDQAGGQADPTNGSPINFTVVFSEPVNDFATGDVTLSGAAGATTATVTGGGMTYNVAVNGMTGDGTVTATVAAGVAQDAAGNTNNASTTTDDTVTYDTTGPTVTIDQAGGQA